MFISMAYPTNYIQEVGILRHAGEWVGKFGRKPLIIAGRTAWSKAGEQIEASFRNSGLEYQLLFYNGECSEEEVTRLLQLAQDGRDIVVGVGGGKCMDISKYAAHRLGVPVATVSTLASTCAATTPLSVLYKPNHEYDRNVYFDRCPVLTLVDPNVVAQAPLRYLAAGIGDTIVKWYEAAPINAGKFQNAKTRAGLKMAELAKDNLLEFSEQAAAEYKDGIVGEALKMVIDTNILIAGLVGGLGNQTCRASGAHSFCYGMTTVSETSKALHGEIVGFGLLCQLMLEKKPQQEIVDMMRFYLKIGLPVSLHDLFITEINEQDLRKIAQKTIEPGRTIHYLPIDITEEKVYQALKETHELGEKVKRGLL